MNLTQMLSDNTGAISSMRSVFVTICAYIIAINLAFNVAALIKGGAVIPLPMNDIVIILGMAVAKAGQSFIENKKVGA